MQTASPKVLDAPLRRRNGIYYMPPLAAQVMARWAIRSQADRVLERCFGSGVFLTALGQVLNPNSGQVRGVEMMDVDYNAAIKSGLMGVNHSILGDFLDVTPFQVDTAIGNPPYVRLRSLPTIQGERARRAVERVLGTPMDSAGNVWMAFVLHATRLLAHGGRFAFVLPYEITHVRYAKPLWKFLGSNFGDLRLVSVKERIFPNLMQEVVILYADNRGNSTATVCFEAYERARDMDNNQSIVKKEFPIQAVIGERPFVRALLPHDLDVLLQDRIVKLNVSDP